MTRVVVVGAGIVGLACAWAARRRGFEITLVDPDFEGDRASHGNAGAIAIGECLPLTLRGLGLKPLRWLVDPLGPLAIRPRHALRLLPWFRALRRASTPAAERRGAEALAALNRRALPAMATMLDEIGLASALHRTGALTVYESRAAFEADAAGWRTRQALGFPSRPVAGAALHALEPALSPHLVHGVLEEDGGHVDDPRRIVEALRDWLGAAGSEFVAGAARSVALRGATGSPAVALEDGRQVVGDRIVVAAGAWSGLLARSVGDRPIVESERGYNATLPASRGLLSREITFAERHFVVTPLAPGLRIGGAAEFAGLAAAADYRRSERLLELARRFLPGIDETGAVRWMGQRPSTPDSLPVIGPSPRMPQVVYAFGHGHLGLTQSAVTGELVAELVGGSRPEIDPTPYAIGRFDGRGG